MTVRATKKHASVIQAFRSHLYQRGVTILDPENVRSPVSRKSGGVENDDIKISSSFTKAFQPVQDIADKEFMIFDTDTVELVIAGSPIEIPAGQVNICGVSASSRGSHPECTGV
jgi:hypothetical protein